MFKSARIKLTTWYLIIIMAITLTFSSLVYVSVAINTERVLATQRARLERQFFLYSINRTNPRTNVFYQYDAEAIMEIRNKTFWILVGINITILMASGTLGYFLSGKTLAPIEEMLKKQKRFISDAAHEIKTPLTAMKTDLEVTLRDKNFNTDDAIKTIQSTIEEVDKLNKFTNKLLEQGKYQNETHNEIMEELDLAEVLTSVIDKVQPLVKEKKETITFEKDNIKLKGYKSELEKLFTNLVENAVKYSHNEKNIDIEMYTNNKMAVVKIKDYGIGIEEKDLPNIFEPFYRADKARTKSEQNGFGLGLAIAKEIVKAHNGTIEVKSKVAEGTTFIVRLPISDASQHNKLIS